MSAELSLESSVAMHPFETTSITAAYRQRCEDRVRVVELDGGVVIVVADGAGGSGAGAEAAETVIREVTAAASLDRDAAGWCDVLRQTDHRIGEGESTCVVVARTAHGIVGASVGDSRAWLLENDEIIDLTAGQRRKPLLGTTEARPVGLSRSPSPSLLLLCTDGFCNYVRRESLLREILRIDFAVLASSLVEMVRLPSGELWDDVGIVACRPRCEISQTDRWSVDGKCPEYSKGPGMGSNTYAIVAGDRRWMGIGEAARAEPGAANAMTVTIVVQDASDIPADGLSIEDQTGQLIGPAGGWRVVIRLPVGGTASMVRFSTKQ